jgi:methylthioribulose-1-phosphate dehydratase
MSRSSNASAARDLAAIGRRFYTRGWVLGTSGNFSTVLSLDPLRLAITASSVHKGTLRAGHILEIDRDGGVIGKTRSQPSAETLLHLEIVNCTGAGAVLHTHSMWGTMLSDVHAERGGLELEGYEMLKGLRGVRTHTHREWIPIIDNDQDMTRLSGVVRTTLASGRDGPPHAFLLRRHGLYTWGETLTEAERHVEILEFLFETVARTRTVATLPKDAEAYHGTFENS